MTQTKNPDIAELLAYGWDDLAARAANPDTCQFIPDFTETDDEGNEIHQNIRYRWPDDLRDEVLPRFLALNKERAEAEAQAAAPAPKATKARAKKAIVDNHDTFDFGEVPADPQQAITTFLSQNPGPHPKAAILSATGVTDTQWTKAIKALVDGGLVKQEGEKKGARYSGVNS